MFRSTYLFIAIVAVLSVAAGNATAVAFGVDEKWQLAAAMMFGTVYVTLLNAILRSARKRLTRSSRRVR